MSKRAKLTADKARQRITKLEESIHSRGSKLESLNARISRSTNPDEKLLTARDRLERRLNLEQEQVQKLKRLLERHSGSSQQDSSEYYGSEDIEDLHRSFEEVRQDLTLVKSRLESADIPRDLPSRLASFEERIARREEVSSDLYGQILNLENALDQERQTVRRLSRKIREQDQSMDALREAVEDSVVATVDLVERLEELEENNNAENEESPALGGAVPAELLSRIEALKAQLQALESRLENSPNSEEILMEAISDFDARLEGIEQLAKSNAEATRFASEERAALHSSVEALTVVETREPSPLSPPSSEPSGEPALFQPQPPSNEQFPAATERVPAVFSNGVSNSKVNSKWRPANFELKRVPRFP